MPIAVLTVMFLILDGALWYQRPGPNIWPLGSLVLGFFGGPDLSD